MMVEVNDIAYECLCQCMHSCHATEANKLCMQWVLVAPTINPNEKMMHKIVPVNHGYNGDKHVDELKLD